MKKGGFTMEFKKGIDWRCCFDPETGRYTAEIRPEVTISAPAVTAADWKKKTTKLSVWACFVAGVGITLSNMFLHYIKSPINAGAITMLAGLVIVPVVSLLTPKMDSSKVEEIFSGYEETITIKKRFSLMEDADEA